METERERVSLPVCDDIGLKSGASVSSVVQICKSSERNRNERYWGVYVYMYMFTTIYIYIYINIYTYIFFRGVKIYRHFAR